MTTPAERDLQKALDAIRPRFESANAIPVRQATVPAHEWHALLAALASSPAKTSCSSDCTWYGCGMTCEVCAQAVPSPAPSLTDEQIDAIWHNSTPTNFEARSFARAVLALAAPVAQPEPTVGEQE